MLEIKVAIGILIVLAIIICVGYFVLSRKSEKLKKQRKLVWALSVFAAVGVYFGLLNHVYILNKESYSYDHKILVFRQAFTFDDQQKVTVSPKLGFQPSVIINNSPYNAVFETVNYGTASGAPDILLAKYTATYINGGTGVDYVFSTPPNSVRTKGSGAKKGWIHYTK